jgi:hypothetical protein
MAGRQSQAQDIFDNPASKIRYEAYSRLQAAAVAFGEQLPIPEIVAIGGQSDGKSSLLEAFLGVRMGCTARMLCTTNMEHSGPCSSGST